jgi:tetratricopeptide (TPR) repeat protein
MRISRLGVFVLIAVSLFFSTNCSYYNKVMARKALVDGSKAYKDRKFPEAERLFRDAVARDPNGDTIEGKTAQLFLARTLHSEYIGNRQDKSKAEEAITQYKKALEQNPSDQSSYKAIASLYENLQRTDDWQKWVTARAQNTSIPPEQRAEALTSLAAKKNTCANDISDTDKTKKTITKDGKPAFQFVKPESSEEFETFKGCVAEGTTLIDQAIALEPESVKTAKNLDVKSMTDQQLQSTEDLLKVFESARSYKASLLFQAMRQAEMEGNNAERDKLKEQADAARNSFLELSDVVKKIQAEIDARTAAKEEAANTQKAANNSTANKK